MTKETYDKKIDAFSRAWLLLKSSQQKLLNDMESKRRDKSRDVSNSFNELNYLLENIFSGIKRNYAQIQRDIINNKAKSISAEEELFEALKVSMEIANDYTEQVTLFFQNNSSVPFQTFLNKVQDLEMLADKLLEKSTPEGKGLGHALKRLSGFILLGIGFLLLFSLGLVPIIHKISHPFITAGFKLTQGNTINHSQLIKLVQKLGHTSMSDKGLCQGFAMMWTQAVCAGDLFGFKKRMALLNKYKSNPEKLLNDIAAIRLKCKTNTYTPTVEEYRVLEIPAFFDGIALYMNPEHYSDVLYSRLLQVDTEIISKFTTSKDRDISRAFATVDHYNKDDLEQFLKKLEKNISGPNEPVAITFKANNHIVNARAIGEGKFEYIDTNSFLDSGMTHWIGDAKGLAKEILSSLNKNGAERLPIVTEIFTDAKAPAINFDACRNKDPITQLYPDANGYTVMHWAAVLNDMALMNRLDVTKIDFNKTTSNGNSAFAMSHVITGLSNDVTDFLRQQKNINIKDDKFPLLDRFAEIAGSYRGNALYPQVIAILNNPEMKKPANLSVLLHHLACNAYDGKKEALDVTKILLEKFGSNSSLYFSSGWTPMHTACASNKLELARLLVSQNAFINRQDEQGASPLHIAAERDGINLEITQQLIKSGADCNLKDKEGRTAFDIALQKQKMNFAKELLSSTTLDSQSFGKHWSLSSISHNTELCKAILEKGLTDYITQRNTKSEYGNILGRGYSKTDKIQAAQALLAHLKNQEVDLAPYSKALQNGRLADIYNQHQALRNTNYKNQLQAVKLPLEEKEKDYKRSP